MSTQTSLDFDQSPTEAPALRVEPTNLARCIHCGTPRDGSKPGLVCGPKCRIERSMSRRSLEAEGYLAPRPLLEEPEARRDVGKAMAAANHREHLELARRLALRMLGETNSGTGTISDLREYAARHEYDLPWHLNWTASVFLPPGKGQGAPWFEKTGLQSNTRHKKANARKVNEYRLTAEGRAAYLEGRHR